MPLGNGDVGLNLWIEEDGDLLFYISKTDAWSGNGRLLKLGQIRVSLTPNPFAKGTPFRQTLRLKEGEIEVIAGEAASRVTLRVWVDANRSAIHVQADGERPTAMQVRLEVWRTEQRELKESERFSAYGVNGGPQPICVEPDTILPTRDNRIRWFHRNTTSCYPVTLEVQALSELLADFPGPLMDRTFGGCLKGEGFIAVDDRTLRSARPATRHHVTISPFTAQTPTADEWPEGLDKLVQEVDQVDLRRANKEHREWWAEFWDRSWIFAETPSVPGVEGAATTNELLLRIGGDSDGRNRFVGRMGRASVFDRALTDHEVLILAEFGFDKELDGLPAPIAGWRFDTMADNTFADRAAATFPANPVGPVKIVDDPRPSRMAQSVERRLQTARAGADDRSGRLA